MAVSAVGYLENGAGVCHGGVQEGSEHLITLNQNTQCKVHYWCNKLFMTIHYD